jgi:hypothetical protein
MIPSGDQDSGEIRVEPPLEKLRRVQSIGAADVVSADLGVGALDVAPRPRLALVGELSPEGGIADIDRHPRRPAVSAVRHRSNSGA